MDISTILEVISSAPHEVKHHYDASVVTVELNKEKLWPHEALSLKSDKGVKSALLGYVPLIFPELVTWRTSWADLVEMSGLSPDVWSFLSGYQEQHDSFKQLEMRLQYWVKFEKLPDAHPQYDKVMEEVSLAILYDDSGSYPSGNIHT